MSKEKKRIKVYTRTGDQGMTSLYNGKREPKNHTLFEALGDIDELNSALGYTRYYMTEKGYMDLVEWIDEIQSRLLDIGSSIATPPKESSNRKLERVFFDPSHADRLEEWIDVMDLELSPLKNFIIPGGTLCACSLHSARTIARRAERIVFSLTHDDMCDPTVGVYINRLSDFLFVCARVVNVREGVDDVVYKKV